MTKGEILQDDRSTVYTDNGPGLVGHSYSKRWNGADNPKVPRVADDVVVRSRFRDYRPYRPHRRARTAEHAYSMTLDESRDKLLSYQRTYPGASLKTGTFENSFGAPSSLAEWTSNDEISLINKLRASIQGSDFNIGVFLAEGHEALQTIASVAGKLYAAHQFASKGDLVNAAKAVKSAAGYKDPRVPRQRARKHAKRAADQWNEVQYGMLPLLNDVEDAAKFLAHIFNAPPQQTYTVSRTKKGKVVASVFEFDDLAYRSVKIKAIVRSSDMLQLSGLTDLRSVVWEKIPYSFVVDWFIPIGNFLSALNVARSLEGTFVRTEYHRYSVSSLRGSVPSGKYNLYDHFYHRRVIALTRTVTNQLFVPLPSQKGLEKAFSLKHAVNAVSLLTSFVFRKVPT